MYFLNKMTNRGEQHSACIAGGVRIFQTKSYVDRHVKKQRRRSTGEEKGPNRQTSRRHQTSC